MFIGKNVSILFEDENLLVADKPAGLLTIPAPGGAVCLTRLLDAACEREGLAWRAHPCHRLDGETSGIVLFAKGKGRQKTLMELFRLREIRKTYIAFVQGRMEKTEGAFTRSLEGKTARTVYKVREHRRAGGAVFAVAELNPETGRKNQIRLHFRAAGHPLAGETRFAFRRDFPLKVKRLMLHAARLEFADPWMPQIRRVFESPLPADMRAFLDAAEIM